MSESRDGNRGGERVFALVVTAVFLLVATPVLLRHEMWRDELQAWLIARDATSLSDLFRLLRSEGHPAAWYLLLRPLARAGLGPGVMQMLALGSGAAAAYVFARFAPFTRRTRALFAFGYFPMFGYAIVARGYGLQLLLLLVACAFLAAARPRALAAGIVLLLAANVSVYGAMLVLALVLALLIAALRDRRSRDGSILRGAELARVIVPATLGVALAAAQVRPLPHPAFGGNGALVSTAGRERESLRVDRLLPVWRAYVPIPNIATPADLASSDMLSNRSPRAALLALVLSVGMVVLAAFLVRATAAALAFYLIATAEIVIFSVAIYHGTLYHHGHLFVALVMAAWLAFAARAPRGSGAPQGRTWLGRHAERIFALLLVVQVVGNVIRLAGDWLYPYSNARNAAAYLAAHGMATAPLAAHPDFEGTAVSGYLGRAVFLLGRGALATYEPHAIREVHLDDAAVLARARACCVRPGTPAILLRGHALRAADSTLQITPLHQFVGSIVGEDYYLYELQAVR